MAACSARSSDFGSIAAVHNLELQRHLSRRTAAALMNGSEEERQTKLEIRLGANTRLAQGYHDSYFLKECHAIR